MTIELILNQQTGLWKF